MPDRVVSLDRDRHAVFVIIMAAMAGIGAKLIEIAALDRLKGIGDAVQFGVLRGIFPDPARRMLLIGVPRFKAGTVTLRRKAPEPDAGVLPCAAAHKPDGASLEVEPEDFRDALEIFIDGIVPVIVEAALTIPGAGLVLGRIGQFAQAIDGGFDDLRCRNGAGARR